MNIPIKIFLLPAIFLSSIITAQQPQFQSLRKITPDQGLSSSFITRIKQDSYGFLWVGTQDGLNRFDGKSFSVYTRKTDSAHQLGGILVTDIAEDRVRKQIWVSTSYGNVVCIDERTGMIIHRIEKDQNGKNLADHWIRALCIDGDKVWVGLADGLFSYNISTAQILPSQLKEPANVARLYLDKQKRVWALCDNTGVLVIDTTGQIATTIPATQISSHTSSQRLRFWDSDASGENLYMASNWGLLIANTDDSKPFIQTNTTHSPLDTLEIFSCGADNTNTIWASTQDHLYRLVKHPSSWTIFHEDKNEEEDWFSFVYSLFADSSGYIWIGTQEGLAGFNYRLNPFTPYYQSSRSSERIKHAYSFLALSDSTLLCGDENGLFRVNRLTKGIEKVSETGSNVMLLRDKSNELYLSNKAGLQLISPTQTLTRADSKYPELKMLRTDFINAAVAFDDSLIIFSSVLRNGIYCWNKKRHTIDRYGESAPVHQVPGLTTTTNLFLNSKRKIIILSDQSIFFEFDPLAKSFSRHTVGGFNAPLNFMDVCETASGYWFGTYGNGVVHTTKNYEFVSNITTEKGLTNDVVYKIIPYADSLLFVSTNYGLSVIHIKNELVKKYYAADGLHSNAFEQMCGLDVNGRILLGGVNGFTVISPANFSENNTAPLVYFNRLMIETRKGKQTVNDLELTTISIPSDVVQTNIYVSAINYSSVERTRIKYHIREQGNTWSELATGYLPLIGIAPGTYHLQVQAFNEDGVGSAIKELTLVFLPKWYQTWWFKASLALLFMAIVYGLYRIRINQFKKEKEIRSKLASDLHDDLGSTMNSVKIYTNLALMGPDKDKYLPLIKEGTQDAITGIRDIIWVLDNTKDSIEDLLARVTTFAGPLCEANGIRYKATFSDEARHQKLAQEERRNLYMMMKEAVNNAVKYAGGENISISVTTEKKKLCIIICDDGRGFDGAAHPDGNGLKNMHRRAKEIRYSATIQSAAGKGTTIIFRKR